VIPLLAGVLALFLLGCDAPAQEVDTTFVQSSDAELRQMVAELLPDVARRSGLELVRPVRVERRSREELVDFLTAKLNEELSPEEEEQTIRAYALLGMVPADLDLRGLLLSVYTEQVAGFYDPDVSTLFVMDDQPAASLVPLLVHELVHAVQDQAADLDSLTDKSRGNDRQAAAQAAIEGHATLVMFEQMMEMAQGSPVDLTELPSVAEQLRPALESMRAQYPALGGAPRVIQESVLFPYLEGASFVQSLWTSDGGERLAPFGDRLPQSTEQVLDEGAFLHARDAPTPVRLEVEGDVLYDNTLGELETRIFLDELLGGGAEGAADGWDGDHYVLTERGLAWGSIWDTAADRDLFVETVRPAVGELPEAATIEAVEVEGRPGVLVRVGPVGEARVTIPATPEAAGG